jgi:hypothetical protein
LFLACDEAEHHGRRVRYSKAVHIVLARKERLGERERKRRKR